MNYMGQPVFVGQDYGCREVTIDDARIARYSQALELNRPEYRKTAPGLLLHSECYEDLSWYLANLIGNLHARQEWELFRPVPVGATVITRGFIRDRYRKRGRDYVVKETWVSDAEGRLYNRGITHQSFLVEEVGAKTDVVDKSREKRADRRFEVESEGGRELAPFERTVSEAVCMAFSGPEKTYHTDRAEARKLGFPDIVVQGMLPICYAGERLREEFGARYLTGGKLDVRLVNVLWAGEAVRAGGRVREETPEAGRTRVWMDVWVEKTDGTKVVVGQASAIK